jgi:cystathionine beta-lyase family protein involved in aluminum resistance
MLNIHELSEAVEAEIQNIWRTIESIEERNLLKVLKAFQQAGIGEEHLTGTTGYGYDDLGREGVERVYSLVFGTEAALVRPQIVSGTHAIATCLFGLLRPGDQLLSAAGAPYDTLQRVIGVKGSCPGSLVEHGVSYNEVPLDEGFRPDLDALEDAISRKTKLILIQRSRGYSWRPALTIDQIASIVERAKAINPQVICFVDNCYGEFVERFEPTQVGADIMAGSLIKNPGAGIVPGGGYIVGNKEYVEMAASRLTAPGLGSKVGPTLSANRLFLQGFFMAPHIVAEALKTAVFTARLMEELGFIVSPRYDEARSDIVQAIKFGSAELLVRFCQEIQKASPVDSYVTPEPAMMPGYEDPVIMAGGTFIQGSSIELSADGPIREPYICYMQGGLSRAHGKMALLSALENLLS